MRRVRIIVIGLLMIMLCSCGIVSEAERYVARCWDVIGTEELDVDKIYVMQYTSRLELTGEVLDTDMYLELPERGYVVLFHSYCSPAFYDSYACFFNQKGKLVYVFDYEENDRLFEKYYENFSNYNVKNGVIALEYISNCNYIAEMINDADDNEYKGKIRKNMWYSFSDKQIEKIVK